MTRSFGAGVCYDNVARFINGESIEVVVAETEKAVAAQTYEVRNLWGTKDYGRQEGSTLERKQW